MPNKTRLFPNARYMGEGSCLSPSGALVNTSFIDLGGSLSTQDVRIAKLSKPEHGIETAASLRLSCPQEFRNKGEVLLRDPQEGRVNTASSQTVDTTRKEEADDLQRRVDALNVAARLNKTVVNLKGSQNRTKSHWTDSSISFGKEWLIYCTTIYGSDNCEDNWRGVFPESYTCSSIIHRPTQFAQALGMSVCEHVGACGKPSTGSYSLTNFLSVEMERISLFVVHGPTLYVDNPYDYLSEAKAGWETLCAMIFLKSREHAGEKEYRFAALPIPQITGSVVYLPVSGTMRDCLIPPVSLNLPPPTSEPVVVPEEGEVEVTVTPTTPKYTYRRRVTRTKRSSLNAGKGETEDRKEEQEVVEETVVSPEEVREPFPNEEEKTPDVIIFHQYGTSVQYIHEAFRDVETERWRVETVRRRDLDGNAVTDVEWPEHLSVPSELAYEGREALPWAPELILEYCLDPSRPRALGNYDGAKDWTVEEFGHVLACRRSLKIAVELVPELQRERAAASAWYALGFVADLVSEFGPIVRTVCIIREAVAVVELSRARFSGAVGWLTFSGSGAYTLYIRKGDAEEFTLPGRFTRAHPIGRGIYADALHQSGWHRKK